MANQYDEEEEEGQWQEEQLMQSRPKLGNNLPVWGNPRTMNLNHLVLTNIQNSSYFKVRLFELKTYHEVVDEIYYKVEHLEPWERGTRKTAGQTGMCGGVRGVGAGGVVSTCFCCLFKLFTLKLTRKQVNGLLNHPDSPYIRGIGIMYVRYSQPPKDLWDFFEPFLDDEEEVDVKSGGGCLMTIGTMIKTVLTKLEWFATLFPRIPVPIEKQIQENLRLRGGDEIQRGDGQQNDYGNQRQGSVDRRHNDPIDRHRSLDRVQRDSSDRNRSREKSYNRSSRQRSPDRRKRSRSRDHDRHRRSRSRERRRSRERKSRSRDRPTKRRSRSRDKRRKSRSRSRDHKRSHRSR